MSDSAWIASDTTCPPLVCLVKSLATGRLYHVPRSPPSLHVLLELLPAAILMLGERTEHGRTCQHQTKCFHHILYQHVSLIRWYAHFLGEIFVASEILFATNSWSFIPPIHRGFYTSHHHRHILTIYSLGICSASCRRCASCSAVAFKTSGSQLESVGAPNHST